MRQDRRHARSYIVASDQGGMAHADSGDVGDRVVFAHGQNADDDAQVAGARTGSLSSRLAHCFKGEKQKANAEGQKRGRWAQPLSSFSLHRFHLVFPGNAVEDSNSGIGTESIDAASNRRRQIDGVKSTASNRIIHQLCGFPHHDDGAITLAPFVRMITIGVSMRHARGEAKRTKRRQKRVGNGEWGMGMRKGALSPLPLPIPPLLPPLHPNWPSD